MCFFFSSRRRHTRLQGDWSSDVCSSDLYLFIPLGNLLVHVGTERRVAAHLLVQGRVLLTQALFQRIGLVIDPVLGLAVALLELLQALALGVEGAIEFQRLAREILHARGQAL